MYPVGPVEFFTVFFVVAAILHRLVRGSGRGCDAFTCIRSFWMCDVGEELVRFIAACFLFMFVFVLRGPTFVTCCRALCSGMS